MSDLGGLLKPEEVDFLLESEGASKGGDSEQEVTMRGDLDQISLSDIFQTLSISRMEGLLRVRNPLEQRVLHFHGGFVRIMVPNRVAFRRLGQRLVHAGFLQPEQLRLALLEQRRQQLPLGQLLAQQGIVSQDQVEHVINMQVSEELFSIFTWRHGTFEFFKGPVTDPEVREKLDQCIDFEINSLLLEVARQTDEWNGIMATLGCLDEVPDVDRDRAPAAESLPEHQADLIRGVDGKQSYRELSDSGLLSLFDLARAARELVQSGALRHLGDIEMVEVARYHIELGNQKRALVTVQTLRDRPGEREPSVLMALADVLRQCGESGMASAMLIEVARAEEDPRDALDLARQARAASGRDPEVLKFLRQALLRSGSESPNEIEEVTIALLDEHLDRGALDEAMSLIEECENADSVSTHLLLRKARLLQRHKDIAGAVEALMEIARAYSDAGEMERTAEVYEQVLKLDRSRRDVWKALRLLRSTRKGRMIKAGAILTTCLMVVSVAVVMVHQQRLETQTASALDEVARYLREGDRVSARRSLAEHRDNLGALPQFDDLHRQIDFADAAEKARLNRGERKVALEKMAEAAELLARGQVEQSLTLYNELHSRPELGSEVAEVVQTRLEAMRTEMDQIAKLFATAMPEEPPAVPDTRHLQESLDFLRGRFDPGKLLLTQELISLHEQKRLPSFIGTELADNLVNSARHAQPFLEQARERLEQLETAMARVDNQRRLDPLFKAAIEHERKLEFTAALEAYRRLVREHGDGQLRSHFRDQVERYAGIVRYLEAIAEATQNGDFSTAQGQYRALRLSFPDVPFEQVARLPLRVQSRPAGASVLWNGIQVGTTPLLLSYLPGEPGTVSLRLDGFTGEEAYVQGDLIGAVTSLMSREPDWEIELGGIVDQPVTADPDGHLFVVDRSGSVTAIDSKRGKTLWNWRSGDLSGFLSPPLRSGSHLLVCSLDGPLRAIAVSDGRQVWRKDGYATEFAPVLVGRSLAVATTDGRLVLLDAETGTERRALKLPGRASADLTARGDVVLAMCHDGSALAIRVPRGDEVWRQRLPGVTGPRACAIPKGFGIVSDSGLTMGLDLDSGKILWRRSLDAQVEIAPVCEGGSLAVALPQRLVLLDPATGKTQAQAGAGESNWSGSVTFVDHRVFAPRRDGTVHVLGANELELRYQLRGPKRLTNRASAIGSASLAVGTQDRRLLFYRNLP